MMNFSPADDSSEGPAASRTAQWPLALSQMQTALQLLDESDAPAHLAAQLDLAIQQLREEIARSKAR
jgi:hypothetical protein